LNAAALIYDTLHLAFPPARTAQLNSAHLDT